MRRLSSATIGLSREDSATTAADATPRGADIVSGLFEVDRRNFAMAGDAHGPSPRGLLCNAGAGAAAGVIAATFVSPLDVIKTRLQVHGLPQLASANTKGSVIVGSLEHLFQKEGLRGIYRGLCPMVLALLPNWAAYFTIYDQQKSYLGADDVNHQLSIGANMMAASGAGAASGIRAPLGKKRYSGVVDCSKYFSKRASRFLSRLCHQPAENNPICRYHFYKF